MYHFSLNLLRDPLNWLTNWADGTESYESEEICGRLRSRWLRLMFWGPRHGRQVIWGKGQLVVFLPFYFSGDQYHCTKFRWTGHWSITTLPSCTSELARSCWQAGRHTVPLFSAQGHVFTFPRAAVHKSHPRNKDIIAFLWYVHKVFSCQGYLGFYSAAGYAYHLLWMAARERRKSEERLFNKLVMFFSEEFVFTSRRGTSTHPPDSHFL